MIRVPGGPCIHDALELKYGGWSVCYDCSRLLNPQETEKAMENVIFLIS